MAASSSATIKGRCAPSQNIFFSSASSQFILKS
jgi:hypothetical protein